MALGQSLRLLTEIGFGDTAEMLVRIGSMTRQEALEDTTRSNAASRRTRRRRRKPPPRFRRNVPVTSDETLPMQRGQDNLRRSYRSRRRPLRYSDFVAR